MISLAGTPTTVEFVLTSRITTAPEPTNAHLPTVICPLITVPLPINPPSSTITSPLSVELVDKLT